MAAMTPANMRETAACPSNHGAACIALAGAILVTAHLIKVPPRPRVLEMWSAIAQNENTSTRS